MSDDTTVPALRDDLLKGVREIAEFIGEPERRTVYLLEREMIPSFKIGARWHARRSVLDRFYGGDAA